MVVPVSRNKKISKQTNKHTRYTNMWTQRKVLWKFVLRKPITWIGDFFMNIFLHVEIADKSFKWMMNGVVGFIIAWRENRTFFHDNSCINTRGTDGFYDICYSFQFEGCGNLTGMMTVPLTRFTWLQIDVTILKFNWRYVVLLWCKPCECNKYLGTERVVWETIIFIFALITL